MTCCTLCGAVFDSYRKMYSHRRSCREKLGHKDTQRKLTIKSSKPTLKTKPIAIVRKEGSNITIVDQSTTNIAVQVNVHHYHVHIGKVGKLAVEDSMKEISGHLCLSHLCTCSKCSHIKTDSPLITPITRIHHSADRFMDKIMKHVSVLDNMPVMKGVDQYTLYGGQEALSKKIREMVSEVERSKNIRILQALGINEEKDIRKRVRQLEHSLVTLTQQIESYQRMGEACADAFLKRTPGGVSTRTIATDNDLKALT